MAASAARAVGVVWRGLKGVGKLTLPDNPEDLKEAVEKAEELMKVIWGKGSSRETTLPMIVGALSSPAGRAMGESQSRAVKIIKALAAAGVVYSAHHREVAAHSRLSREGGVGLFMMLSEAEAPTFMVSKTGRMIPAQVASAASLVAGVVCPGLRESYVRYEQPPSIYGSSPITPTMSAAGFGTVVLLAFLATLFKEELFQE